MKMVSFIVGSCIASFVNVMVIRSQKKEDFITGRSHCPFCNHQLSFLDTFPVAGWLLLRGKCRYCSERIPLRYPMVELLGGFAVLACYLNGDRLNVILTVLYGMTLLAVSLYDIDTMEIPITFLLFISAEAMLDPHLKGALIISVPLAILAVAGKTGWGDVMLSFACGLFLGYEKITVGFMIALLLGSLQAVIMLVKGKELKSEMPFAPALCLGYFLSALYGQKIWRWYVFELLK